MAARPILVLQYPDLRQGRTIALAATRDWEAMQAFKRAALTDARLTAIRWGEDELLRIQGESEIERLEALLGELIPEDDSADG